jgi:hypothetical protein
MEANPMPYVLPQVQVFQQFSVIPDSAVNPLRAHISGGHAKLIRYAETDERPLGRLGYYDRLIETAYDWPNRPAGGKIDESYFKLWMKDALLLYFEDTIGTGSVITKTAGYNNRVRSATVNFAANGDDYPRDDLLLDRDVQVGDIVKVRGLDGDSNPITLWTYVKSLIGDTVASDVGDATADADNGDSQGASSAVTQVAGDVNCVTLTPDESAYDGITSGFINETYDILVVEGSVNGDFTTAKLRVISGSGEDDVAEVTPEASGSPTDIGTRGLTVTFDKDAGPSCSDSAESEAVSPDDLIVGQRWQVTVAAAFTANTATSGGTYDNDEDTTYIVTVSRGGLYAADDQPQIMVTTTNGVDLSGPTTVTAASTPVDAGTLGVTISFDGTGLRKGDRFYVVATGETVGPMRTIELGHNLDTDIPAASQVDVTLFIKKALLEIPQNREGFAPTTNWELSDTEITVAEGVIAYDATWTDGGVEQALDVYSEEDEGYGELFAEVRYWLADLCTEVGTIRDVGDIDDLIPGALHPDNPLKWGVFKALENANGTDVKFTAVCDPDDETSWADVLELLLGRDDVYGLVPLTRNQTVLDLYVAHVNALSSAEQGLWRVVWVNLAGVPEIPIVAAGSTVPGHTAATTSDGEVALAVVGDDPDTSGSQYTILRNTNGNADFLTKGVAAGDVVRLLYTGDGFGNVTYSEFVVDEVTSEDQLRLLTGPDAPVNVAAKFEIWRNLSATREAAEIAANAGSYGDRRVRAVWPDTIESSGTVMDGYFLCAALAGLVSGVLPQQGLTNVEISGFTDVPRTTSKFNRTQLDTMAGGGAWIVTQELSPTDSDLGRIYSRQAVTTGDGDDVNQREEMVTRNVDSISYRFKEQMEPFIGKTNVTPVMLARIGLEVSKLFETLKFETNPRDLGPQLIDGEIVEVRAHATLPDRIVVKLNLTIPYPLNVIEVYLTI